MATTAPGMKRSSREPQEVVGGGSKKKKKIYSRSNSRDKRERATERRNKRKRKQKDRERERDRDKEKRLKVRSISELAELVKSGQVQVPKSLDHYKKDKVQLLDQIFTILSPDDVKGMIPDILKGLRTKQVRELCYKQLVSMSDEEIDHAIIGNTLSSPTALETGDAGPSKSEATEKRSEPVELVDGCDNLVVSNVEGERTQGSHCKGESVVTSDEEIVIDVSDVSDGGEDSDTAKRNKGDCDHDFNLSVETSFNVHIASARNSLPNIDGHGQQDVAHSKKEMTLCDEGGAKPVESPGAAVSSKLEDKLEGGKVERPPQEIRTLGVSELLEMELRKRALEAEIRRTNSEHEDKASRAGQCNAVEDLVSSEKDDGVRSEGGEWLEETEDAISVHPQWEEDGGEELLLGDHASRGGKPVGGAMTVAKEGSEVLKAGGGGKLEGGILRAGEILEERLRNRALHAMMAKKEN